MRKSQKDKGGVPTRIFASYSMNDAQYARKLRDALKVIPGVRIYPTESIIPDKNFVTKMRDEISACDVFFVIITHESAPSHWVLQELGAAWALEKIIIPVVTDRSLLETLPISLKDRQAILLADLDKPEVLNRAISLVTHTAA
jgi:hypothetical protein